jgi:hypothetical protein
MNKAGWPRLLGKVVMGPDRRLTFNVVPFSITSISTHQTTVSNSLKERHTRRTQYISSSREQVEAQQASRNMLHAKAEAVWRMVQFLLTQGASTRLMKPKGFQRKHYHQILTTLRNSKTSETTSEKSTSERLNPLQSYQNNLSNQPPLPRRSQI